MTTWMNWARTERATPTRVLTPRTTHDVAAAIKQAQADRQTIRMVGAGHSFTGAAVAEGVQLRPDALTAIRSANVATGVVTVEAGADLARLCEELDARGLALTNMGDIRVQTIAGALQTGTHGTGRTSGAFATQVLALELALADGSVVTVSRTDDPDLFDAARVGLGAFGVVTSVTLQTEPVFLLRAQEQPFALDEVLDRFDEWSTAHDHVEFYWFPHTSHCLLKRNDRVAGPANPLSASRAWLDDSLLANTVFGGVCRLGRAAPRSVPRLNAIAGRLLSARDYTDTSWRVFTSERRVRFVEQEYAIPREHLAEAVRAVQQLIDASGWTISFPIEVRVLPADDVWLSTAYGRDSAYIAVHCFERTPHEDYFRGVERLLVDFGGRPHWGKLHTRTAKDLREAYPRYVDAVAVRDRVDPDRLFSNPYVDSVLGT